MTFSKYFFLIVLSLIISSGIIQAQVKIIKNDGSSFFGFVEEENDSLVKLITIQNEKLEINKSVINVFEKLDVYFKLKNKSTFNGNIIAINDSAFTIQNTDSSKQIILLLDIDYVHSSEPSVNKFLQYIINPQLSTMLRQDEERKINYKKIGFSYGSPGDINFNIGLTLRNIAINLSIGLAGGYAGVGLNIFSNRYLEINFLAVAGIILQHVEPYSGYSTNELKMKTGFVLDFNLWGINFQAGYGFGIGIYSKNMTLLQIGYNYRFSY